MGRMWLLLRVVADNGPNACPECGCTPHLPERETVTEELSAEEAAQLREGEVEGCPRCERTLSMLWSKEVGEAAPEASPGRAQERFVDRLKWERARRQLEREGE